MSATVATAPAVNTHNPHSTSSSKMNVEMLTSGDQSFEKFFEEVIASPELNLLDDVFAEEIDQKPQIQHNGISHMSHPILHRLQPISNNSSTHRSILKSVPTITPNPVLSSGGISPTLTWSGDPSPVDHDSSPTLHDSADLDGEEWKPSLSLFGRSDSRGRESGNPSRASSQSRSRSSKRSASSTSADGGDELTMSTLSIQNGTTSLAFLSSPPSPSTANGAGAHTPKPTPAPSPRKRTRTGSSSRSSISSIDALISEAMGSAAAAAGRLIPTGHRRNITSASLVPIDAPTQVRNYLTPSSTSKKEIPSAFVARRNKLKAKEVSVAPAGPSKPTAGRKRTREEAGLKTEPTDDNEHVDELQDDDTPLSPEAMSPTAAATQPDLTAEVASESSSLLSAIEAKRRQNTLAARRSRQRKLDYVRNLEELVAKLTRERDTWKDRAESAEHVLGYRPGQDEMDETDEE